jgi:hypothetical protein
MCFGAETIERKSEVEPVAKPASPGDGQVRVFQDGDFVVTTRNGKAFYLNTSNGHTSNNGLLPGDFRDRPSPSSPGGAGVFSSPV